MSMRLSPRRLLALPLTLICLASAGVHAQDHHERERHEHFIYDTRHGHAHYYPTVGYSIAVLPDGFMSLSFGSRRLFFHGGVWYEPGPHGYMVIRPPLGAVIPVLPPDYSTVMVANVPYYYANETYYALGPGGYVVTAPPAQGSYIEAPRSLPPVPVAPPATPMPPAPQPNAGVWYYCNSSRTYYPYVQSCAEGWQTVPATPPGGR